MAKELDVQAKIVKSVKVDGGYARKLTNRFTIGIPDLLIAMWPHVPCLAEVKDLGVVVDKFNLQLDVTEKQGNEMKQFDKPYDEAMFHTAECRHTAMVLVAIKHLGKFRLVALPHAARRLDHTYVDRPDTWVERGVGGYYNIAPLLQAARIARVRLL